MERSVDEHATDSSQPCRKGKITDRMLALEAAYEEYRLSLILQREKRHLLVGGCCPVPQVVPIEGRQ